MKILVPIKRVVDINCKVRPSSDGRSVDLANTKMAINPFCEIAVEEAVRIKEGNPDTEVVVVSVGPNKAQDQLRAALAMGADRALLIETDLALEPLAVAKALRKLMETEVPDLVLLGKQSVDSDNNQTGQILAGLCQISQGTNCSRIALGSHSVEITREVDDGQEMLSLKLPAVLTVDLRLNEPRYASLPDIMKAKKKHLQIKPLADVLPSVDSRTHLLNVTVPTPRKPGIKVASAAELAEKLKFAMEVPA